MKLKVARFTKAFRVMIADRRLKPCDLKVLLYLMDRAGNKLYCFPSEATIASDCGMSDRYVRTVLKRLQSLGFIEKRPHRIHSETGKPLTGLHNGYVIAQITEVYGDTLPFGDWKTLNAAPELGGDCSVSKRNHSSDSNQNNSAEEMRNHSSGEGDTTDEGDKIEDRHKGTTPNIEEMGEDFSIISECLSGPQAAKNKEQRGRLNFEVHFIISIYCELIDKRPELKFKEIDEDDMTYCKQFLQKIQLKTSQFHPFELALIVVGATLSEWVNLVYKHRKLDGYPSFRMFASGWLDTLIYEVCGYIDTDPIIEELDSILIDRDDLWDRAVYYRSRCAAECQYWHILPLPLEGQSGEQSVMEHNISP